MASSWIQQADEPLGYEIASSPRSILYTGTLHDHVQENIGIQPAALHDQFEDVLANIPPPVGENIQVAMQGNPQDRLHIGVAHCDMEVGYYHRPQPGDPAVPHVYRDAGFAQDVQVQPQAIQVQVAPEVHGNSDFGPLPQNFAPGPAQAEFPDAWARHAPVRDYPQIQVDSADNLGRLARGYIDRPDSQVTQIDLVVRMEPGQARRFSVVITLEVSNAL